jgi:hypothetical protein
MVNLQLVNCGKRQYTLRFLTFTRVVTIVLGSRHFKPIIFSGDYVDILTRTHMAENIDTENVIFSLIYGLI